MQNAQRPCPVPTDERERKNSFLGPPYSNDGPALAPFIGANPRHNALLAIHFIVIPKGPQDSNTRPAICCPGTCTTPSFRQSLGEIQSGLFKRTAARSASTLTRSPRI